MAATVQLINDRLLREAVAGKLSTRLGMPLADFWMLLKRADKPRDFANSKPVEGSQPGNTAQTLAATHPIGGLTLLALGDADIRRWITSQPWSPRLMEMEEAGLLVKILDSDMSVDEPSSIAAFSAGLDAPAKALLDSLLRERLPEDRLAAARDYWGAIEKRELLHRRDLLKARLREPDLSHGEITEIQKQILDLQKHLTDISRPFSPSGPE
jgi:hypothetical protein